MTIICTVCGTANPDGTQYCEGCGVELAQAQSQVAQSQAAQTPAGPAAPTPLTPPEGWTPQAAPEATASTPTPVAGVPDMPLSPEPAVPTDPAPPQPQAAPAPELQPEASAASVAPAPVLSAETASPAQPAPAADMGTGTASLGLKKYGAATGESIPLQGERLVVGRFDASSGPVDIDLSGLGGQEHISRRHAELYREGGVWKVRDLGSTNGVYLKRRGEPSFSPRLQEPAELADGDELAFGNLMFTFQQA